MNANPKTILNLFEPTHRFVVPMFQRHYVWSQEAQWEPLWSDIEEKLLDRQARRMVSPHFLGAVILDSVRKQGTREVTRFVVIDGQQRLTTFQLLLAALRDTAACAGSLDIARAAERYLLNQDTALMENPEQEKYKMWPTLANRAMFCQIITAGSADKVKELYPIRYGLTKTGRVKKHPEPRERLVAAYEFFQSKIQAMLNLIEPTQSADEFFISLLAVLRDDFTIVEIVLGEDDESQEIFNSLNARGKPLEQSDLLRSYIFMRAEKQEKDRDRLFERYWSMFEKPWWDDEVRRGNQTSSQLDILTRALLSSKKSAIVDVRRVHAAYTDWIRADKPYASLEDELREFAQYGVGFEQLNGEAVGPLSIFGQRMRTWETTTVFPLALYLVVEAAMSSQELAEALSVLEAFIVRRAICGLQTKEYNKYFVEVIGRLRKAGASAQTLRECLSSGEGDTRRYPSDQEFSDAWKSKPLYRSLSSYQLILVLRQLELAHRTMRAEDTPIPKLSIEHVMPQRWTFNYPIDGEQISSDMDTDWYWSDDSAKIGEYERLREHIQNRRKKIHTIGNLTIVTQGLNAAMQNAAFADKKESLRESVLALNRYFDNIVDWNEDAITKRSDILFNYARKIWSGPILPS